VPFAKRLDKKVFMHLHDYQPISYNATVFSEAKGITSPTSTPLSSSF